MSFVDSLENEVHETPLRSAGLALGAGFLLSRLPVIAAVGLIVRVALSLIRPALLVLGVAKAYDLIRSRKPPSSRETAAPDDAAPTG